MQVKQADILFGLDKGFIARLMEAGVKSTFEQGTVLFNEGNPTLHFYILVKGRIKLSIGEGKNSIYMINHGGEAFGWSALTGRNLYTASATCIAPSTLFVFDRDKIEPIMAKDTQNAMLFYKNLALTLGNRLTMISSHLADHLAVSDKISYGTGQVQESAELV